MYFNYEFIVFTIQTSTFTDKLVLINKKDYGKRINNSRTVKNHVKQ